jgi:site-specific recombinase XerD
MSLETWHAKLESFEPPTKKAYEKAIENYEDWCLEEEKNANEVISLLDYIVELREEDIYTANSLKGIVSKVSCWFKYNHNLNAYEKCPLLMDYINKWLKEDTTKQSLVFNGDDLAKFLNDENLPDETWLTIKVIVI